MSSSDPAANLELRVHHASAIRASNALAETIRTLVNEGYEYMTAERKLRWDYIYGERLPTPESLFEVMGKEGMFAVLYHLGPQDGFGKGPGSGKPIACAATKRWVGDLEKYKGDNREEEGWEILTVTTLPEYMKRGYAGRCIDALVKELHRQAKDGGCRDLTVWTQAVEELNGAFWRNRGWVQEVRSYDKPVGHWGSRCGYRLLVMKREFAIGSGGVWVELSG